MADTTTAGIGLTIQTQGGNTNTWGVKANANFDLIDAKFSDETAKTTTGGTTALTADEIVAAAIKVSGALVSNATITFASKAGIWFVRNNTSGSFTVSVSNGGTVVAIPQGGALVVWSDGTDFYSGNSLADASVTLAKMANVATGTVFYRKTAGTGVPEVQTLATLKADLGLTGTNSGDQTITLTGDVTGSGTGSFATTIAASAVTLAMMADLATDRILGRPNAGGTGAPMALTAAQVSAVISSAIATDLAASQAEMETASSTAKFVSPGRQQFHPGHPKCWLYAKVTAGVPAITTSYNITSVTDTGFGQLGVTIATDFSSANWCGVATADAASNQIFVQGEGAKAAAGTIALGCFTDAGNYQDPAAWNFVGFGDQA